MSLGLESFRRWRRRVKAESHSARTIPRWERPAPNVPAAYLSLYDYLEHRYATTVVLTFEQIETLLGCALPTSASTEPGWWTTPRGGPPAHSAAWAGAGRTAVPNLLARNVTFERHG
jgi:hypothetical protein